MQQLGQPEIGQHRRVVRRQEHVRGLDVAVHHAVSVRIVEARRDPAQVPQRAWPVEVAVDHPGGEAAAGDVLDDHVRRPLELAEVVDVDDVRVPQLGDRLRLVAEPGHGVHIRRDGLHDFDRAGALERGVIGLIDQAHGPLAYEILDLVLSQLGTGRDRHGP